MIGSATAVANDRYLSRTVLGESAWGKTDAYGQYGLDTVSIRPLRVNLLHADLRGDGLSNAWRQENFGTPAGPPAEAASAPAPVITDAEALIRQRHAGARVLIADDEALNRGVVQFFLEASGLVVDVAEDGEQALELAAANDYALILMDVQMPRLNGLDAARRLRALPGYGATPILAMTANALVEDKARCVAAGMNDFVAKPFNPDLLFACLLRWLGDKGGHDKRFAQTS